MVIVDIDGAFNRIKEVRRSEVKESKAVDAVLNRISQAAGQPGAKEAESGLFFHILFAYQGLDMLP